MSRILKYKSTSGNGKEYIISRSISQPKLFWNLSVMVNGKEKYHEEGYRRIKDARHAIEKHQLSNSVY